MNPYKGSIGLALALDEASLGRQTVAEGRTVAFEGANKGLVLLISYLEE